MKFWQQYVINDLNVCAKFQGNKSRDFGFRTRKPTESFSEKAVSLKNGLSTIKNISHGCMFYDTFSSPPTHFWPRWILFCSFLSFFSIFFFLNLYVLLPLNHKTSKSNFCVKLLRCKHNFVSRNFLGLHPKWGPKNQFFKRLKLGRQFF